MLGEKTGEKEENTLWNFHEFIFEHKQPAITTYLEEFSAKADARTEKEIFWWELRAFDYYNVFENLKLFIQTFAGSQNLFGMKKDITAIKSVSLLPMPVNIY